LILALAISPARAANRVPLVSFCVQPRCTGGAYPSAGLLADPTGDLFGTTAESRANNGGTVFVPEIRPGILAGYLSPGALPDSLALIPLPLPRTRPLSRLTRRSAKIASRCATRLAGHWRLQMPIWRFLMPPAPFLVRCRRRSRSRRRRISIYCCVAALPILDFPPTRPRITTSVCGPLS
jgi:hypothetical protein